jgi:hypothetical protein
MSESLTVQMEGGVVDREEEEALGAEDAATIGRR